jgi:hypothetical protein
MIKSIGSNMQFIRAQHQALVCALFGLAAMLPGCASKRDAPKPPTLTQSLPTTAPSLEKFQVGLGDGITLDYQVEKKLSKVNNKSCYAFITGKVSNLSDKTLGKQSVLDIAVMSQGKQLYRDNTSPLADIPTGSNAAFEMVVSPLFAEGCPKFDNINIALRKVVL